MNTAHAELDHWARRAQYIYESHHATVAGRHLLAEVVDRITRMGQTAPGAVALEVGCAAGTQTIALARRGYCASFGLDINPSVLSCARRNAVAQGIAPDRFVLGDAHRLPVADNACDLAYSVGVMEHLPDLAASLHEQRRVIRPGGWLVMAVPNAYCPWWTTGKRLRAVLSRKEHFAMPDAFRTFTPAEGVQALEAAGLRDVSWEAGDLVMPQCPDALAWANILLEKTVSRLPLLRHAQAMLYVRGRR